MEFLHPMQNILTNFETNTQIWYDTNFKHISKWTIISLEILVVFPLSSFQCHPNQPAPQPVWDSVVFSFGTRRLVVCHPQGWRKASSATYAARFPLNATTGRKAEVWVFEDRNRRCGLSVLAKGEVSSATMDNLEHSTHEVFAPLCCYGFQCSSVWCPSPWNRWCLWLPQGTLDIDSAMQKLLPEKKHNSIPSQYNVYIINISLHIPRHPYHQNNCQNHGDTFYQKMSQVQHLHSHFSTTIRLSSQHLLW